MKKEEFITQANQIHKNFYDYSKVESFTKKGQKVTIICPNHGPFQQLIASHLGGIEGCRGCHREKMMYSWEDFLENSRKIHGEKYTYFEKEYVGRHQKTKFLCPQHGIFFQVPEKHLTAILLNFQNYSHLDQQRFYQQIHKNFQSQLMDRLTMVKCFKRLRKNFGSNLNLLRKNWIASTIS